MFLQGPTCERNMNYHRAVAHPMYIKTYDTTINKQVFCDTYTDKGGWIIIQVVDKACPTKFFPLHVEK